MSKNHKYYLKPGQKSKVLLFLVFGFLFCQSIISQSISWQRTYDGRDGVADGGFTVCKADVDNFYICGITTLLPILEECML